MKSKYLWASLALCSQLFANETSLNELIDIALKNNTNISLSKLKVQSQKANVGITTSAYLPKLDAQAEVAKYDIESQLSHDRGNVNSYTLTASQLLYDFGKTTSNIASSKEQLKASLQEQVQTTSQTVLDVKEAYYDILNQYKLIEVAQESVKIDQLQLEQVQEYFKAGIKTKIDLTNAQLQLSNSKLDLLKAQYDLKTSKSKLITILGQNLNKNFEVQKEKENLTNLSKRLQKHNNLDTITQEALDNRAEIHLQKALIQAQKKSLYASKMDYLPSLSLQGSYKDGNSNDISSLDSNQGSVGVYLTWNLFSGFKTQNTIKQNLSSLKSEKERLKQQELSITQEVLTAFYNVQKNIDALKIAVLNVDLAKQSLQLAQERYKNGLNDIVELNNSKLDFIKAKNDLVNTFYTYKSSQANLDYAQGIVYTIQ